MSRIGLIQLNGTDRPAANLAALQPLLARAAAEGARLVMTPEVTNCISASRARQEAVLRPEAEDMVLGGLREAAACHGVWILAGSLALAEPGPDGRFVNRSLLIAPDGAVVARYDKIHMFDVAIAPGETWRESAAYRPGDRAVVAATPLGRLGMTICYDLRFPALYRRLAAAGAEMIAVPSAFSVPTGKAHWHALLRARAIETGAFILAPAQCGTHAASEGRQRRSWGHGLAVAPWGEVLCDMGDAPGVAVVEVELAEVARARRRIPAPLQQVSFTVPS